MRRRLFMTLSFQALGIVAATGCGSDVPKRVVVTPPPAPPALDRARRFLTQFSLGTPVGSQVMDFDSIVADLKVSDPAKAVIVQEAFDEFKKMPGQKVEAKAKQVLSKL